MARARELGERHRRGTLAALVGADDRLGPDAAALLAPGVSVTRRTTHGAGSPVAVVEQLARFRARLARTAEQLS